MEREQSHIDDLISFLRFPSISTLPQHFKDVKACAIWLNDKLASLGLEVKIYETAGHPIVVARNQHLEKRKNVMIYGHYDVQPVDPLNLWSSDPFEPEIRDGKIWARGASDNKGQLLSHILGIEKLLQENGEIPLNLTFLFEGEEEIGSPHLPQFLKEHRKDFEFDIAIVSDMGLISESIPAFSYSLRGIACAEILLRGSEKDLHSGIFGGVIANPLSELSRLIAFMHDENGHICIPGFYDGISPVEDWEKTSWKKIDGFSEEDILATTGVKALSGEKGYTPLERLWARPTAELNGIWGGYQGEGSKTIIPAEAGAKISFRLVAPQCPDDILNKAEAYFQSQCPPHMSLNFVRGHSGKPYLCDTHSSFAKISCEVLTEIFGNSPVLLREGASIPIICDFKEILGVDTLMLGLALPDCNMHSPDESFSLEVFEKGISLNMELIKRLAEI